MSSKSPTLGPYFVRSCAVTFTVSLSALGSEQSLAAVRSNDCLADKIVVPAMRHALTPPSKPRRRSSKTRG